jgi:molybdopterin molybdotransferase
LFFGSNSNALIFGLPGNPVSAFIGFMEYVWPVLESMTGQSRANTISAVLDESFPLDAVKTRYLFGNTWSEDGQLICAPSKKVGSHMLSSSLEANCIIVAGPGYIPLTKGAQIRIRLLPWKSIK